MSADLSSLLRSTHISNHEHVLKAANNALRKSKSDVTAQHARTTALLKLDRYDDAVRAFDEHSALKDSARLEYAYALYKAGRLDEAAKVAERADSRGLKHVLAQTTYRLEKFDAAQSLYRELADRSPDADAEANDLRINGAAVDALLEWSDNGHLVTKKQPSREDLEAFESAYNAACGAVGRGELGKAEVLLRRARDLCLASEELSEDEKKAEMVPLVTQMAYVLLRLGRAAEAKEMAADLHGEGVDEATKWIGQVNQLVINAEAGESANPYLTYRILSSGKQLVGADAPFKYQTDILHQNSVVTALLSSKHQGVKRSTANVLDDNDEPTTSPAQNGLSVLNAAAHARGQSSKTGLKAVLPLLEERPTDVGLLLTVVHLYCLSNNHGLAISLLESFFARLEAKGNSSKNYADVRHAPGLVAVLVSLYTRQNRTAGVKTELSQAASYWRSRRKQDASIPLPVSLLRAAGTVLLSNSSEDEADAKAAAEIFQDLHTHDPNDRASTAGLIASLALTSPPNSIPQDLLTNLTPSTRLIANLDPLVLETAGIPTFAPLAPSSKKRAAASTTPDASKKRTRLSKKRTPKEYDPATPNEDKERWLPLRDRSYWRPKGKKGKNRANNKGADLTQGGVVDESLGGAQVVKGGLVVQGGNRTGNKKGKKKR